MQRGSPIGKIVVLNGASSAGKTSTARALLDLMGAPAVHTGLDHILDRVQPFGAEPHTALGRLRRSAQIVWFQRTDGRLRLFKQLHREVVALAQAGRDVIVDTALMDPRALRDAAVCFGPVHGLFVGMKPPLQVSERWEAMRGDRERGHARKHYDLVHAHGTYDLVLDPSVLTPQECARAVLQRLADGPPTAFRQLLTQM
ncbi:MAG: AAA family ATPase [Herpetosiphonaceae bacterium]|nr:AAA family ATPase [Herpetosiphonaceae bacterium]